MIKPRANEKCYWKLVEGRPFKSNKQNEAGDNLDDGRRDRLRACSCQFVRQTRHVCRSVRRMGDAQKPRNVAMSIECI